MAQCFQVFLACLEIQDLLDFLVLLLLQSNLFLLLNLEILEVLQHPSSPVLQALQSILGLLFLLSFPLDLRHPAALATLENLVVHGLLYGLWGLQHPCHRVPPFAHPFRFFHQLQGSPYRLSHLLLPGDLLPPLRPSSLNLLAHLSVQDLL